MSDPLDDVAVAISIYQPYASLIMAGLKVIEWRSWPAPTEHRGTRIGIHAAQRKPTRAQRQQLLYAIQHRRGDPTFGRTLSTADLEFAGDLVAIGEALPRGALLGSALLGFPYRAGVGPDTWAWPMSQPVALAEPWRCRGYERFFNWRLQHAG